MISVRFGIILAAALCLGGCITGQKPQAEAWSGGDPARLGADQAACRAEAANLDVNDANNYSDPRYGVASAMAEAVAKDNPMADRGAVVRQAAYQTCMNDKGWRSQQ